MVPDPTSEGEPAQDARRLEIEFTLDGRAVRCPEGLTVAGALYWLGEQATRLTPRGETPRSLFCGMGVCFDCVMEIDGRAGVRSCTTLLAPGMRVATQRGAAVVGGAR